MNRKGAARLASCALPALVAGRRVFVRDRQKWKELHRLPGKESIATLCVVELGRAAVLLASGDVQVLEGGAWKTLVLARRGVATSASRVVWLGGALRPVVATETGKLYRLDGSKPVALGLDARLSGFRPSVAASANKREWIVGVGSNASSGVETSVIVRLDGKKLVLVDELPLAVEGEWIGMVATDAGVQLLATRDGTVVRRGESGAWVVEKLPNAASASPSVPRPDNPPARVGATPH